MGSLVLWVRHKRRLLSVTRHVTKTPGAKLWNIALRSPVWALTGEAERSRIKFSSKMVRFFMNRVGGPSSSVTLILHSLVLFLLMRYVRFELFQRLGTTLKTLPQKVVLEVRLKTTSLSTLVASARFAKAVEIFHLVCSGLPPA